MKINLLFTSLGRQFSPTFHHLR